MDENAKTFEQSLTRLEEIVKKLDDGRTDLTSALAEYEEGVGLLKHCHGILEGARRKIEILRGIDENGEPITEIVNEEKFKTSTDLGRR